MKLIGITGGIGSGKSTVSNFLIKSGFDVIDADQISRDIIADDSKTEILNELIENFGIKIAKNGILDRKKLAQIAFSNITEKKKLDDIMLPKIISNVEAKINEFKKCGKKILFLDAPLLFESGLDKLCSENWLIYADEKTRILRVMKRDGVSETDVLMRMQFQMPDSKKKELADFVIENLGNEKELERQIKLKLIETEGI